MNDEIKVYVIDKKRKSLYLKYHDPLTGRPVEKSAGTSKHSEAVKAAGKWESELREGRYQKRNTMTWEMFRQHFEANATAALSSRTEEAYDTALNSFERICAPRKLTDATTGRVTMFVTTLRNEGKSDATIACYLRHLKACFRWAHRQALLQTLPQIEMPKRAKGAKVMRGRPITLEEFERIIEAVPKVVENAAAESWRFYIRGLWESGLRLGESLSLRWDDAPGVIVVDLAGRRPMFRIPCEAQKGNRDTLLPMTPQFAELLASVPERDRRGRVFKLLGLDGKPLRGGRGIAGKILSEIGESACVVVDERQKNGEVVRKFASAHDLRRAFGQRWSLKVMPTVLRELMRYESIETTMKYYVGQNAQAMAEQLWAGYESTSVDFLVDTPKPRETAAIQKPR